jgi:hypothetical protein
MLTFAPMESVMTVNYALISNERAPLSKVAVAFLCRLEDWI